ncbi:predicted protein [Sclerotinia sclerotiorum 1980 UF-70]|uniref:Uncharacterized protein n=1 Tax=Sclerotinia sclerotiorum (strain ATCC 18683 / 1980 / Ss-1) TaxID=665079 RepID=A7F2Q8_SCLS1|nr:predicted protein [Sclerotinia sclerotiorum 1980 UF-70]EDN96000.1 predicted protein [Sclerotinia sclerotiorum 1980 UF-70]
MPKDNVCVWTILTSSYCRRSSDIEELNSLSTAFGLIKGEIPSTAPTAAILVSDQDYSERPNRHIINTTPPPFAAI